jgi:hypothetical protein
MIVLLPSLRGYLEGLNKELAGRLMTSDYEGLSAVYYPACFVSTTALDTISNLALLICNLHPPICLTSWTPNYMAFRFDHLILLCYLKRRLVSLGLYLTIKAALPLHPLHNSLYYYLFKIVNTLVLLQQ